MSLLYWSIDNFILLRYFHIMLAVFNKRNFIILWCVIFYIDAISSYLTFRFGSYHEANPMVAFLIDKLSMELTLIYLSAICLYLSVILIMHIWQYSLVRNLLYLIFAVELTQVIIFPRFFLIG